MDVPEIWRKDNYCREKVYIRETYRRTGRGRHGFEMHYTERQCRRKPKHGGYCFQHANKEAKSMPASLNEGIDK